MSNNVSDQFVQKQSSSFGFKHDHMADITTLHRIASVAIERIILLMNNTEMCKIRPLENINQVLDFLAGKHDDEGLSGDRGDFYRRKLADQMHVTFAIEGVTHTNVQFVAEAAIVLERETRNALPYSLKVMKMSYEDIDISKHLDIDEKTLEILCIMKDKMNCV